MAQHEVIIPNEGLQFKIFEFEGKAGNYFRESHWHRSIEIFAVYKGGVHIEVNEKRFDLKEGEFVLINSNEVHSISSPIPNSVIVLQFPLNVFENYYNKDLFIYFTHSPREEDSEVMKLVSDIYLAISEKKIGFEFETQSKFYQLLYLLVVKYRKAEIAPELLANYKKLNKLSVIIDYLYNHYQEPLSLELLAEKFGYSSGYLSRMFKKYAKVNFKTYLQGIRMEFAFRELMNTDYTILEIALNNGFPTGKAFSNEFRKKYNMSPVEYRKKFRII